MEKRDHAYPAHRVERAFLSLLKLDTETVQRIADGLPGPRRTGARIAIHALHYYEARDVENKGNPNHDPENGQFTSGSGGTSGHGGESGTAKEPKDVTEEYKKKATPGVGKIEFEPGYRVSSHGEEMKVAQWVHNTFGGDITLLKESTQNNVKTPDYRWNDVLWELKTVEANSQNAVQQSIRTALHQIESNPGGIFLDVSKCGISLSEARKAVTYRMNRSAKVSADVMMIYNNGQYSVIRFSPNK